jgi:(1->4)-alpha-D-glucan 1-alpha-D-glucosylmutase
MMAGSKVPIATYRLQFNKDFTFNQARSLVPYLHGLGISHLYASPIFRAGEGSAHGYDVTDPTVLNPELGTQEDFEALVQELRTHGMGLLVDIVPNHMAANSQNPWWIDLLESGPASPYASYFDVDWKPVGGPVEDRVVLPILGKPYPEVLESGELALALDDGGFNIRYYDNRLPLEVKSYGVLLSRLKETLGRELASSDPALEQLQRLIDLAESLPPYSETIPHDVPSRQQSAQRVKQGVLNLSQTSPVVSDSLRSLLSWFNGKPGEPQSFDFLHRLLFKQPYRLTFWQTGRETLNYRRFFDITGLVGVRVEAPAVFKATHALVFKLVKEGKISGLRLDHIDGLYDPTGYLRRLQEELSYHTKRPDYGFYVVVEKILAHHETLPEDWPVAGTTGYDFLNSLNGVFVDRGGFERLVLVYHQITGATAIFSDVVYHHKKKAILELFGVEARKLSQGLFHLAQQDRYACDLPQQAFTGALVETTACLPVYRTYSWNGVMSRRDQTYLNDAINEAGSRSTNLEQQALDFLKRVLQGDWPTWLTPDQRNVWQHFVAQWQQFSGPAMAKGLEDTSLYIYHPLVSLNEVGGHPTAERLSVEAFHQHNAYQQLHWPHTMNATSTHDTKRSEDVRARINVLSECPEEWIRRLKRWGRWNRTSKQEVSGQLMPDANTEVLLYQTLVGAWPLSREEVPAFKVRLKEYLIKAAREAKTYTTWLSQDPEYESFLVQFSDSILNEQPSNRFLPDFLKFQKRIAYFGALNSLSQTLLKITSPGVPDFYQGTELWDFSLVDPDNRRPVDFTQRFGLLDQIAGSETPNSSRAIRGLLSSWGDGRVKLYTTHKALDLRLERQELFSEGEYIPLEVNGQKEEQVCAFARRLGDAWTLTVVPRLLTDLVPLGRFPLGPKVWGKDSLILPGNAPHNWVNIFTDSCVQVAGGPPGLPLSAVFDQFPVALLVEDSSN